MWGRLHEGGGNFLKYPKRGWNRKEGRGNKTFKRGGQAGLRGGCLKKPYITMLCKEMWRQNPEVLENKNIFEQKNIASSLLSCGLFHCWILQIVFIFLSVSVLSYTANYIKFFLEPIHALCFQLLVIYMLYVQYLSWLRCFNGIGRVPVQTSFDTWQNSGTCDMKRVLRSPFQFRFPHYVIQGSKVAPFSLSVLHLIPWNSHSSEMDEGRIWVWSTVETSKKQNARNKISSNK